MSSVVVIGAQLMGYHKNVKSRNCGSFFILPFQSLRFIFGIALHPQRQRFQRVWSDSSQRAVISSGVSQQTSLTSLPVGRRDRERRS